MNSDEKKFIGLMSILEEKNQQEKNIYIYTIIILIIIIGACLYYNMYYSLPHKRKRNINKTSKKHYKNTPRNYNMKAKYQSMRPSRGVRY